MPIIKSAKKKLRQDKKRTELNQIVKRTVKSAINKFKTTPNQINLSRAFSALDRAVKKNIFHPNNTSRIKSNLSLLIKSKTQKAVSSEKTKVKKVQ